MSIVNFEQLKEILESSWVKTKEKIKKIADDYVSKTLPNSVTGETMITNGYVGGESTITKRHNETRANMSSLNRNTSYYGIPSLSVPARTYVDKIICIMHDSAGDIGTTATGVNVGVVSKATGRILEYLKTNQTETIIANPLTSGSHALTGDKAISISINKAWQEEVYFIVGAMKMMAGHIGSLTHSVGGDELKEVGYNFGNGTPGNYIGRMVIYTSKYSLNEIATKSLSIDDIKNDYVSKTSENVVSSKTTLLNGCVLNSAISIVNNTNATGVMTDSRFAGSPSLTARGNTHISYLCVAVDDSYEIGREISGIKIAAVNYDTNRVKEVITTSGKAIVCENIYGHIDSRKVILYPIQKSYDVGVYFIVGFYGMKWGRRSNNNWLTVVPSNNFPGENTSITLNTSNWIYQAAIFAEETKLNEMLTSINTLSTSKAGISNANTFTNTNTFNGSVGLNEEVNIRYVTKYEQLLLNSDTKRHSVWEVYFDRNIYIPAGSYVTYLDIRVTDDVNVDSELSEIYIYEVGRGDNIRNDSIVHVPFSNSSLRVSNVDGFGKCIRAQLNKTFARDTYFIMGQKMATGKILVCSDNQGDIRYSITNNPFVLNSNYTISSIARGTNSKTIHRYNIERVGVLQDDIKNINNVLATTIKNTDIGNAANKIPRVGANGKLDPSILPAEQNGGVRTVNDQSPNQNGNVTVLAEHIKYVNGQNITVKGAIDGKVNESDTVTSSQANKIVKLDGSGKLNDNMLPATVAKSINGQPVSNNAVTIYADNINIDNSTSKTIKQALNEGVQKDQNNNFTKKNDFNFYAPTVTKSFTRMSFNDNDRLTNRIYELYNSNSSNYFVTLSDKFEDTGLTVSYLLLPIKNSQVGDTVSATWFVLRNNKTILQIQNWFKNYTVEDIDMVGCKCIRIPVNVKYSERVMFGFSVQTKSVGNRTIGMAYANDISYSKEVWTGSSPNQLTNFTNNSPRKVFPYKILYDTTSEVVTRFELENVSQIYPKTLIGEMKQLSYDAGNSLEDGTNTWLRANGQAINSNDYPELYEKFNTSRTDDDIEVSIPSIDSQAGYYYICAK